MRDKQVLCQTLCETLARRVGESQLCCAVELDGPRLLHVQHSAPSFQAQWLETIAESVDDLFCGKKMRRLQRVAIGDMRADLPPPNELFINSTQSLFFLKRIPALGVVLLLATSPQVKQGLGWMALRNTVKELGFDTGEASSDAAPAPIDDRRRRRLRFDSHLGVDARAFSPEVVSKTPGMTPSRATQRLPSDAATPHSGRVETGRLPEPMLPATSSARLTRKPRLQGMGRNLRASRIARGFSVRDLARRLGVTQAELESWEKGQRAVPERLRPGLIELIPSVEGIL